MRPLHAFSRSIKRFLSIIVKYRLNDYNDRTYNHRYPSSKTQRLF
ncbi:hypothetical protein [Porphyromonas endodontalis]|nr:hypothetical protein [Porphyromonas endodontalis]